MSSTLPVKIFDNPEFGQVRWIIGDNEFQAVGVDIARALEYANPSKAVIDHCKGITKLGIPSAGGIQETNVITEGDIYRLIFKAAEQSKNPEIKARAERFESWIFDEVLPSIRKTGSYSKTTNFPWAEDMDKALRQNAKLTKGLSKIATIRLNATTLRQVQENKGHNYSEMIAIMEADAEAQETKLLQAQAKAAQKQAEAEAKQRKKSPAHSGDMLTEHTEAALDWVKTEYALQGKKIAIIHKGRLLVFSKPWREWAIENQINLTSVLKILAKQGSIEIARSGGEIIYTKRPLRVNGGNAPKAVIFKAGCFGWLTSTSEQAQ